MKAKIRNLALLLCFISFATISKAQSLAEEIEAIADIVIDINGSGDYTSIQEGLTAVPDSLDDWFVVYVKNGFYYEKVVLNHKKTHVVLVGEDVDSTIISYDDHADASLPGHTFSAYTFRADPHDFQAYNISFEATNTISQAVAFHSNGDRQILHHCKLLGNQDTYFDNFRTRRYMKDVYIEGDVDFIFGFGVTLFDSCHIHVNDPGYITAASTPEHYEFGYVFKDCAVTVREGGTWSVSLGRPWFPFSNTIFYESFLTDRISPKGWSPWSGREETCIYREYNNFGPGADTTNRVEWSSQLSPSLASRYTIDIILAASNFPSDLGEEVDSIELWSMRNRFEDSGYAERADTILYAGRDYWPEYPKDDWSPVCFAPVYDVVNEYTDFFIEEVDMTFVDVKEVENVDVYFQVQNPVRDHFVFSSEQAFNSKSVLTIFNTSGFSVFRYELDRIQKGNNEIPLFSVDLTDGVYIYQISSSEFYTTGKIVKE